jgi:hypothetical protein
MNYQQLVDEARNTRAVLLRRMEITYQADPENGTPLYWKTRRAFFRADARFYRRLRLLRDTQPAADPQPGQRGGA